jgi:hypothetical protein
MLPVTARKRFLPWTIIDEVVLRYSTLSIECVENKLYQWDIADNDVDDALFMEYCKAQVEINRANRQNDEW